MILIDSSVWIEYFNGNKSEANDRLSNLLMNNSEKISMADVILLEVIQGIRDDSKYEKVKHHLLIFTLFTYNHLGIYIQASDIYRTCRKKGITIQSTIDTIIASICMQNNLELFTLDQDFHKIAKVVPLKLYKF